MSIAKQNTELLNTLTASYRVLKIEFRKLVDAKELDSLMDVVNQLSDIEEKILAELTSTVVVVQIRHSGKFVLKQQGVFGLYVHLKPNSDHTVVKHIMEIGTINKATTFDTKEEAEAMLAPANNAVFRAFMNFDKKEN